MPTDRRTATFPLPLARCVLVLPAWVQRDSQAERMERGGCSFCVLHTPVPIEQQSSEAGRRHAHAASQDNPRFGGWRVLSTSALASVRFRLAERPPL